MFLCRVCKVSRCKVSLLLNTHSSLAAPVPGHSGREESLTAPSHVNILTSPGFLPAGPGTVPLLSYRFLCCRSRSRFYLIKGLCQTVGPVTVPDQSRLIYNTTSQQAVFYTIQFFNGNSGLSLYFFNKIYIIPNRRRLEFLPTVAGLTPAPLPGLQPASAVNIS